MSHHSVTWIQPPPNSKNTVISCVEYVSQYRFISQNASMVASNPVNAKPSPNQWEASATPAFALLGKAGDGSNSDPVPWLGSTPSCWFTGVGVGAAVTVSEG